MLVLVAVPRKQHEEQAYGQRGPSRDLRRRAARRRALRPGSTADEIEPNDGDEVATPTLAMGGTARGKLESESDIDYYRVQVDKPGVLQAMLTGVEGRTSILELADPSGSALANRIAAAFASKKACRMPA